MDDSKKPDSPPIFSLSSFKINDGWDDSFEQQRDRKLVLKKDEWSSSDVLTLVDENNDDVLKLIRSSINAGKLSYSRSQLSILDTPIYFFAPNVILDWLRSKELNLHEQVLQWQKALSEPQAETVASAGAVSTEKFEDTRTSQLHTFIWRVHQFLSEAKKPTAQGVWNEIQHRHTKHDTDGIIQEVDALNISWRSGYGNEQNHARTTFNKTLSNLRKNPPY